MTSPLAEVTLLIGAGVLAGIVNAIAGGGTFFTFAALIAVGLPPVSANATSAVSVLPGQIASTLAYRRELTALGTKLIPLGIVSALGGLLGGWLLLHSDNSTFLGLVPWLLLMATLLFAVAPHFARWTRLTGGRESMAVWSGTSGALVLQALVAIYGGYFGAGMGIMMLASLSLIFGDQFHAANAAKNILAVLMQGFAVILFLTSGLVHWPEAFIVILSSVVGGWLGVVVGRHVATPVIRWFVVATGVALTFWYFFR